MEYDEGIMQYSSYYAPIGMEYDEWVEWIDAQGEIMMQVQCENEVIIYVRIRQ